LIVVRKIWNAGALKWPPTVAVRASLIAGAKGLTPILTDPAPHNANLAGFRESDRMTTLDLPENDGLAAIARSIETAMKDEQTANVRRACADFVRIASQFYKVKDCRVRDRHPTLSAKRRESIQMLPVLLPVMDEV
jgi:hypothetical protein